jgi:hypothetical protein
VGRLTSPILAVDFQIILAIKYRNSSLTHAPATVLSHSNPHNMPPSRLSPIHTQPRKMGCLHSKPSGPRLENFRKDTPTSEQAQGKKEIFNQQFAQLLKDMKRLLELGKDPEYVDPGMGVTVEECLAFCVKHIDRLDMEGSFLGTKEELRELLVVAIGKGEMGDESWVGKGGRWVGMKRL